MNWYYGLNGETVGPVDENQMVELINQGTVVSNTLVWNDQMGDAWITVAESELNRYLGEGTELASEGGQNMPVAGGSGFCSLCGNQFSESDLVEIGDLCSCAACKPMALRRMQQNTYAGVMNYAGFWIRFAAAFVDGIILAVVQFGITFVTASLVSDPISLVVTNNSIQITIAILYSVMLISKMGGTLGMKACGIAVVNADGTGPISALKALGRYFASILSSLIFCIGYFMIAFDSEKRALHDHICSTRVVYTSR